MTIAERPTFGRSATPQPPPTRRLITPKDLPSKGICFHPNHLRRMWQAGPFPEPIHLSPRRIAWDEADIDAWIDAKLARAARTREATS